MNFCETGERKMRVRSAADTDLQSVISPRWIRELIVSKEEPKKGEWGATFGALRPDLKNPRNPARGSINALDQSGMPFHPREIREAFRRDGS